MSVTIGLVANVYQEVNALPGWLETHLPYFDDVRVVHSGPQGAMSTDGTIELLEKWRIPIAFTPIDPGFGVVRTVAIRSSPCDYVMLLDADERFFPIHRKLVCIGEGTPQSEVDWILQSYDFSGVNLPNWENIARLGDKLHVEFEGVYDQGKLLRQVLESNKPDAIVTIRRHWHDLTLKRPTQNWNTHPDYQMRLVRNDSSIYFDPNKRMHEQIIGAGLVIQPNPPLFFDHFHFTFKRMEQRQRAHDVKIYDSIHKGEVPPVK